MSAPATLVMAPVSPAVAKLLHQLQAQIIREASERPVPPGAAILMPLGDKMTHQVYREANGYRVIYCGGDNGSIRLQSPYIADPAASSWCRPGLWYGSCDRLDDVGRRWSAALTHEYVCDDFGQLVPVGGAS